MIDRVIVKRSRAGRFSWKAVDKTGRKIGQGHREFTRLANALRNIESMTGVTTEVVPRMAGQYRVATWGRPFSIEVHEPKGTK